MINYQFITIVLKNGGIIAYPTEAVYGLGCDAENISTIEKIIQLKNRPTDKGLIIIAHDWAAAAEFTEKIPTKKLQRVLTTWPGAITWLFPASKKIPQILCSQNKIAIRITAHPIAKNICAHFGKAIVSTSANLSNKPPARTAAEVQKYFPQGIDLLIEGKTGNLNKPTPIFDALTGKVIRE